MNGSQVAHGLYEGSPAPDKQPAVVSVDYNQLVARAKWEFSQIYDAKPNVIKAQGVTYICHPDDSFPTFTVR